MTDPFKRGRWTEWLRQIEIGGTDTKEVTDPKQLQNIRNCVSKLAKQGIYFRTVTEGDLLHVQRLTMSEWLDRPRARG